MANIKAAFPGILALAPLGVVLCTQAAAAHLAAKPLRLAETAEIESVCAGEISAGWIKVNDAWNPTTCGNPTRVTYNVWMIARYDEKPVGSVMAACNGPAPSGWVIVGTAWNPIACGHPATHQNNMMTIKRLN